MTEPASALGPARKQDGGDVTPTTGHIMGEPSMRQPDGLPAHGSQFQVPTDISLPLFGSGVICATVQLDSQSLSLETEINAEPAMSCGDRQLPATVPNSGRSKTC